MDNESSLSDWTKQKKQQYFVRLIIFVFIVCYFLLTSSKHLTLSLIIVFIVLAISLIMFVINTFMTIKYRQLEDESVAKEGSASYRSRLTAGALQTLNITLPKASSGTKRTITKYGIPGRLIIGRNQLSFVPDNKIRGIDFGEPLNFDYGFFTAFRLIKLWTLPFPSAALGLSSKNGKIIEFIVQDRRDLQERLAKQTSLN